MGFEFDLAGLPVMNALLFVVIAILADAVLGILLAVVRGEFQLRLMAQFVATNVFPYMGGLLIYALAAQYMPEPFAVSFYAVAGAALVKYLAEIANKLNKLFKKDAE